MIQITREQAWQHGYQDGYKDLAPCIHRDSPDDDIREGYFWGFMNGCKQRIREYLEEN